MNSTFKFNKLYAFLFFLSVLGTIIYIPIGLGIFCGHLAFVATCIYRKIFKTRKDFGGNWQNRFAVRVFNCDGYNVHLLGIEYTNDWGVSWNSIYRCGRDYFDTYYSLFDLRMACYSEEDIVNFLSRFSGSEAIEKHNQSQIQIINTNNKEIYDSRKRREEKDNDFRKLINDTNNGINKDKVHNI